MIDLRRLRRKPLRGSGAGNGRGKQKGKEIDKRAPGLSVDTAKTADKATTADRATAADTATNANELGGVGAAGYVQVKAQRLRTAADDTGDADYTANSDLLLLSNLAPGQYLIQGKVEIDNDGAAAEGVACTLVNTIGPTTRGGGPRLRRGP